MVSISWVISILSLRIGRDGIADTAIGGAPPLAVKQERIPRPCRRSAGIRNRARRLGPRKGLSLMVAVSDVEAVRGALIAAARGGEAKSYSELLGDLGHRFTRPLMRALCKTLDVIDEDARVAGEPELAVLVV